MSIHANEYRYMTTYFLALEAQSRGIKVKKIFTTGAYQRASLFQMEYKGHKEVIQAQRTSQTSVIAHKLMSNKEYTKAFLQKAGLVVIPGDIFHKEDVDLIFSFIKKIGFPIVIKKIDGGGGTDVFIDIRHKKEVGDILRLFNKNVMIEKFFEANEYRFFATQEKTVAIGWRRAAFVVGDGKKTIKQLINEKNKRENRRPKDDGAPDAFLYTIVIDSALKNYLAVRNLSLKTVPKKGKEIQLRGNSNLSTGGESVDVTMITHPGYKDIAVRAIKAIPGASYGGVDILVKDIRKKPTKTNHAIIEVNDSPGVAVHYTKDLKRINEIIKIIIDQIYPETKKLSQDVILSLAS